MSEMRVADIFQVALELRGRRRLRPIGRSVGSFVFRSLTMTAERGHQKNDDKNYRGKSNWKAFHKSLRTPGRESRQHHGELSLLSSPLSLSSSFFLSSGGGSPF